MSEFVKLTGAYGNGAFYINVQRVESFYDRKDGGTYVCTTPDGDQAYAVTETPEQIIALIDGPPDRDEMANELAEALKVCISQIEHLHAKFQTTESGNATIAYAKDAIALWESLK